MKTFYSRAGLFGLIFTLLLSSCGKTEETNQDLTGGTGSKTPFIVQTIKIGQQTEKSQVEKSGRIIASSSLVLSSQSAGEISKILVKEGQSVKAGSTLINIKDSLTNLDLKLDQAENALEMQNAGIETSKANLEITVENARVGYEKAKQAYDSLTSKNNIQLDTLINTNGKTLDSYNGSYATYLADLDRSMTQLLYEGDKILGITVGFNGQSEAWDPYLGLKAGDSKVLATKTWNQTYEARGLIRKKIEKGAKFDVNTLTGDLLLATESFESLRKYADAMVYMIQNSIIGGGLPDALHTGWNTAWNGFRGQVQSSEASFNAWKSQVSTFIKTYSDNEIATKLALASLNRELTSEEMMLLNSNSNLKITYENSRIDLSDRLSSAKLGLEQAEVGYKNAKVLRDATIKQLLATKRSAEIALEQAKRDYSKLRITAPLEGTITKIMANVGQTVNVGTPTLEISGKIPEILLDIDDSLAKTLEVGMEVGILIDEATLTGKITAVSQVSSSNLLSSLRIGVPSGTKYIGKSVKVQITPGKNETTINDNFLPLDSVHIISEGEAEINILSGSGDISKLVVKTGKVEGSTIEILSKISDKTEVILSDVSNYDPLKNIISVQ